MSFQRKLLPVLAASLVLSVPARAAEVDAGTPYQFCSADFAKEDRTLRGICIMELPNSAAGSVMLGSRIIRPGDFLIAEQLEQMCFSPEDSEQNISAEMKYLPVYSDGTGETSVTVLSIRGRRDEAPIAEDFAVETYKNLPREELLKVTDPEDQPMTYTLVRPPKRGEVILREDGSFLYTPGKNKVGTDSFTFTAADPGGNVSREATVTVKVLKTSAEQPYTDTVGLDCRFPAEWLRNMGIFSGETINGQCCFSPEEPVTRGQFLAMLMETLKLPADRNAEATGFADEAPMWLRPYLAAAFRSGLISGYACDEGVEFHPDSPIDSGEAAVMMQSAMNFAIPTGLTDDASVAAWAQEAVRAVSGEGIPLPQDQVLTRSDAAKILYKISQINNKEALISAVFRK